MNKILHKLIIPILFACLFAIAHFSIWSITNRALPLINAPKLVHGFAYSGFQKDQSPLE